MKKFTFMLLAAFIAVSAWAQPTAVSSRQQLPEQFAVKTMANLKMAPEKKVMAPRPALKGKVQAPVQKASKKAKAAPKKAIDLSPLFQGEEMTFVLKNKTYDWENVGTEEEPDYQLVPQSLFYTSEAWTITLDATTMTASITGISGGETAVTGTVDPITQAITIPYNQPVGTTNYGTIGLVSATGAENLVGTLTDNGIEFDDYRYTVLIDGDYAGEQWSNGIYLSEAVPANGTMTFGTTEAAVAIDIDEENYIATIWNFGGYEFVVDVTLKPEGKFVIESQLVYVSSSQGGYYTYATDGSSLNPIISGTGTENALIFGSTWTCYAPSSGYWYGLLDAATITFDGTFVYPEIPDTPATPAAPEVTFFDFWNGEYATVTVTVPCVDAEGNDIKGSLLSYQLYTKDGEGNPVALGEPIAYDNAENGTGDTKTVKLGEEAKNLTIIGAKSIYTASGETNESEIAWFEIPQLVVVPESVETNEYPVTAQAYDGSSTITYTGTALVGVDGTDVYIQGILPHCPNGWAKGTLEEGVVTFPVQCVGTYSGVYIYLAAYGDAPSPVTFTYDAAMDMYVSEDYILANAYTDKFGFYYPYFNGMTIGEEDLVGDFTFDFNAMNVPTSSNVTTDGDITENFEIVKGNATLTISPKDEGATTANRFWSTNAGPQLRVYSGTLTFTVPKGYNITGITFNYAKWNASNAANAGTITDDATNKVATWEGAAQTVVVTIAANTQINNIVVTVEEAPEVAATPATPAITNLKLTGTNYPALGFSIPTVDTNDYPMNVDKLYYTIWYELDEGEAQQFTISAEEYQYVEEDLVEVPYTYNDEWDIYEGGAKFYLNPADFDYTLWKRIGVQSIYYGADERNASEIAWIDNPVYSIPVTVTETLYATFVAPVNVNFTYCEAEAFAAAINPETGNATLIPVSEVPAGTAVVVKAEEAGTYRVNQTTEATLEVVNELVAATEDVTADGTQYILAQVDDVVGFYKVNAGTTIAAGKGYLVSNAAVKSFYPIEEGNATGIETVDSQLTTDNNPIYNLAGQRISKIQKGISIVNGKKILK